MDIAPLRDATHEIYLRPFHINPKHVIQAVENADAAEAIKVDDLELRIFIRTVRVSKQEVTTVAICRVLAGILNIQHVFRIPASVLAITKGRMTPLAVLEEFAQQFGHAVTAGNTTSRFILNESVPMTWDEWNKSISVDKQGTKYGIFVFYAKQVEIYGEVSIAFALGFSIDGDRYRRAIGQ